MAHLVPLGSVMNLAWYENAARYALDQSASTNECKRMFFNEIFQLVHGVKFDTTYRNLVFDSEEHMLLFIMKWEP